MLEWFDAVGYNADIAGHERSSASADALEEWASRLK